MGKYTHHRVVYMCDNNLEQDAHGPWPHEAYSLLEEKERTGPVKECLI